MARRGADEVAPPAQGRLGRPDAPRHASAAWRSTDAAPQHEREIWIDEGPVRDEAAGAVARGRGAPRPSPAKRAPAAEDEPASDPTLERAVGSRVLERFEVRLRDASKAFKQGRYEEARKILRPMADRAPTAVSVRELHGLSLYRLGRWKAAAAELEAFGELSGSPEQLPVLADCYRALKRHRRVDELWEDLRESSPSAPLVAEGRIVAAGSLADRGRLSDAIALLEAASLPKRPKAHHLRIAYALADLHERAGDVPRARQLFELVAEHDPELGDASGRVRALR